MDNPTWAITPPDAADDDYFFQSGAVAGAGAITLLKTAVQTNGTAYKITFYSTGDSTSRTWTVVGKGVGNDAAITETITAGNAGTVTTVNYFSSVTSITASGAMTGNQKVGYAVSTFLLPTVVTILSVNWVSEATAGSIVINRNSTTGTELLKIHTPAGAGFDSIDCGAIRVRGGANTDYAIVTPTTVSKMTFICGG